MTSRKISRRGFIKGAGVAGLGALVLGGGVLGLRACRSGALPSPAPELGPYAVWREVQAALRASPDHTLGRARALVAAGDVAEIHRFVRDEIRLVSAEGSRFSLGSTVRWGRRAALRAGAGTAREKAEILADLIRQTGREAEVLEADRISMANASGLFFRRFETAFAPAVGPGALEDWRQRLGQRPQEARAVDVGAREADVSATVARLRQLQVEAGGRFGTTNYDARLRGRLPIVRFKDAGGGELHADPVTPGATLSASAPAGLRPAAEPTGLLPVDVVLSCTTTEDPATPIDLVRAQWTAEEVAGRQVRIGFKPMCELQTLVASRVGDLRAFTPVLAIQALDGAALDPVRAVAIGDGFTLDGDRIGLAQDGSVEVNGESIGDGAPTAAAGTVASVDVEVDSTRFPDLRLRLRPRDAGGRVVDGLGFGDFAVSDQGERMGYLLRRRDRSPSILFLADDSLSMPADYRGKDAPAMRALASRVEAAARAIHPGARVSVRTTDSRLWENLLRTRGTNADLIVYATDGDLVGKVPTAEERRPLAQGPRVLVLNVHGDTERRRAGGRSNPFDEIAGATRGRALDVVEGDSRAVDEAVLQFLEDEGSELPYEISYRVLGGDEGIRVAAVAVGAASGQAAYEAGAAAVAGPKLASVRLAVRVGGREVTRVLAGNDGSRPVVQADVDAVQGLLLGTHLLSFEGPAPSLSTVLDDVLASRLSVEALDRAAGGDVGLPALLDVLGQGFQVLPGELATLMMRSAPLSGEDFAFAEQGMRCVLYSAHAAMGSDELIERVDILPLAQVHVIAPDEESRTGRALEASVRLAAAEAALFPVNTFALLDGKTLAVFESGLYAANGLDAEGRQGWEAYRRQLRAAFPGRGAAAFCAADLSAAATWVVDRETQEAHALLPDMSGGGQRAAHIEKQLAELDRVISMYNMIPLVAGAAGVLNPVGGVALAIVAAYGQNLMRLYAAASMSIILMDASGIAPAVRLAIASMACNIVKSIFLGVFAAASDVAEQAVNTFVAFDNLVGVTGVASPFSCPV